MHPRQRLAATCRDEAKAYGYTLTIWGAGGLLINAFGTPDPPDVFGYVFGALLGYSLLVLLTFNQPLTAGLPDHGDDEAEEDSDERNDFVAASTIHFIATPGNLIVAYLIILLAEGTPTPAWLVFLIVGIEATTVYNVLTVFEDYIGRHLPSPTAHGGE